MRLTGRTALVTGAAGGIGRATAAALAAEGAAVCVADLLPVADTAAAVEAAGGTALGVHVDVADRAAVAGAVAESCRALGAVDVLVACAGIVQTTERSDVLDLGEDEWRRVVDVNLSGTFFCAQAVARGLVEVGRPGSSRHGLT